MEWRGIIERYRQSGMGINEFCVQEGVAVGTFDRLRRFYPGDAKDFPVLVP